MGAPKGNQYAKNKVSSWGERPFKDALNRLMKQDKPCLSNLARKLIEQAESGEGWALKEIADRLDGKPSQQVIGPEDDGSHKLTIEIVKFANTNTK